LAQFEKDLVKFEMMLTQRDWDRLEARAKETGLRPAALVRVGIYMALVKRPSGAV
jgi:hypothetical protein